MLISKIVLWSNEGSSPGSFHSLKQTPLKGNQTCNNNLINSFSVRPDFNTHESEKLLKALTVSLHEFVHLLLDSHESDVLAYFSEMCVD